MARNYPRVIGEFDTISAVIAGKSLARIGDGELKIMAGNGYSREKGNPDLSAEMRQLCTAPKKNCLVGIPTMDPKGTKYTNWIRHKARFCKYLGTIQYYSSLVTRPDCGAWMETREYVEHVQKIWLGKSVALVAEPDSKILEAIGKTQAVKLIECPSYEAYSKIKHLEQAAANSGCDVVLLSCGPTATCLANRLSDRVHAVDLGSIGGLLCRWL